MKKLWITLCSLCFAVSASVGTLLTVNAAETLESTTVDFTTDDGGVFTAHSNGGWTATDGKYMPAAASAITKTAKGLDLTGTIYVSFDFYATGTPFDFVLLPDIDSGWSGGLGFHLYPDVITVNNNLDRNGWIGDCTAYPNALMDGKAHNVKMKIANGKASFYVDGETTPVSFNGGAFTEIELSSAAIGTSLGNSAQIIFRAADTESYIDNFKVSTSDIEYVAPEQSDNSYTELSLSFSDSMDPTYFSSVGNGFRVDGGKYYPSQKNGTVYLNQAISTTGTTYIAFEYYAAQNARFTVAYLSDQTGAGNGLGFHNALVSETANLVLTEGLALENYTAQQPFAWDDGKVHSIKLKVSEGKISYYADGELVDFGGDLGTELTIPFDEEGYLFFTASSTMAWIDNLVVSASDIPYVAPTQDTPTFEEMETDFADNSLFGAAGNGGWVAEDNSLIPANAWSTAYLTNKIPLISEKTISVDFAVSGGASTQLNIGFRTESAEGVFSGISLHFYKLTNTTEDLRLSYWFGNPFDTVEEIYSGKNFMDGNVHNLKLIVKDNRLSVLVDGELAFREFAINAQAGYFTVQSSVKEARISNLKLVNKAESLSPPDPSLDITYPSTEAVTPSTGTLTNAPKRYNKTYIVLAGVFGGLTVVGAAVTTIVWLKRKKQ